jgi:plasmid stabilization system protein ParE
MKFTVTITAAAKRDLRSILRWIEAGSRSGAEAWFRRWQQMLDRLREAGDTFGLAPEDADHQEAIHQVVFKTRRGLPYRALFIVRGTLVYVLRVRGPGQDDVPPEDLELP